MNLVIDIGNTLVKTAVFKQGKLYFLNNHDELNTRVINGLFAQFPEIRKGIIGSVRKLPENIKELFPKDFSLLILDGETPLPLQHEYLTFETLGVDRIAAVIAARDHKPAQNLLVIESGTCITFDFMDAAGIYKGGGISPGIGLRFMALHNFTDKLPLVEPVKDAALIGNSTKTSIQSGVINGIKAELKEIISQYERNYENLTVILSGGDLEYFDKNLKNNIFAVPNIVLKGLNIILEFNDKD